MKKIILIITLLVPTGIFIFLRFFGKNEFAIPVYYEKASDMVATGCDKNYHAPYQVSDSILLGMNWSGHAMIVITDSSKTVQLGLKRFREELKDDLQVTFMNEELENQREIAKCDLFIEIPWNSVLVDGQRRIRGYYDLKKREEIDRLIVESKILLKQF